MDGKFRPAHKALFGVLRNTRCTPTYPAEKLGADKRAYLDFAKVGDVARVSVNGKLVGTVWKYPYRLDVTDYVKAGKNKIVAEVGKHMGEQVLVRRNFACRQADNLGQTICGTTIPTPAAGKKALGTRDR